MKRGISLYNTSSTNPTGKKGTRCLICTGCGRCPGVIRGMQVVTEKLELPPLTLQNPDGKRLMTVDIGTTTIAMQLYDMTGKVVDSFPSVNPQVSYGADVLSRIEAAKDPGKAADMQKKVRDLMEKGVQRFSKKLQPQETLQMVVAANTTMTYLFMGWNPEELGKAPFTVSHSGAVETEIAGVACHIIPGLSAFVGGDITAGILASGMLEQEASTLLIDLGTNGEMALGNRPCFRRRSQPGHLGRGYGETVTKTSGRGADGRTGSFEGTLFYERSPYRRCAGDEGVRACSAAGKRSHCRRH